MRVSVIGELWRHVFGTWFDVFALVRDRRAILDNPSDIFSPTNSLSNSPLKFSLQILLIPQAACIMLASIYAYVVNIQEDPATSAAQNEIEMRAKVDKVVEKYKLYDTLEPRQQQILTKLEKLTNDELKQFIDGDGSGEERIIAAKLQLARATKNVTATIDKAIKQKKAKEIADKKVEKLVDTLYPLISATVFVAGAYIFKVFMRRKYPYERWVHESDKAYLYIAMAHTFVPIIFIAVIVEVGNWVDRGFGNTVTTVWAIALIYTMLQIKKSAKVLAKFGEYRQTKRMQAEDISYITNRLVLSNMISGIMVPLCYAIATLPIYFINYSRALVAG